MTLTLSELNLRGYSHNGVPYSQLSPLDRLAIQFARSLEQSKDYKVVCGKPPWLEIGVDEGSYYKSLWMSAPHPGKSSFFMPRYYDHGRWSADGNVFGFKRTYEEYEDLPRIPQDIFDKLAMPRPLRPLSIEIKIDTTRFRAAMARLAEQINTMGILGAIAGTRYADFIKNSNYLKGHTPRDLTEAMARYNADMVKADYEAWPGMTTLIADKNLLDRIKGVGIPSRIPRLFRRNKRMLKTYKKINHVR